MTLGVAGLTRRCHDRPIVISEGKIIALRRDRLGWNQAALGVNAGVGTSTIWRLENGGNVEVDTLRAVERALITEETKRGLPPLQFGPGPGAVPFPSPLNSPVTPISTNRENIPKGGGHDPASTRIRELEDRVARQSTEIQELRDMYKKLARLAIKRAESRPVTSNKARRGKSDR